jgi:hypothetical protein
MDSARSATSAKAKLPPLFAIILFRFALAEQTISKIAKGRANPVTIGRQRRRLELREVEGRGKVR